MFSYLFAEKILVLGKKIYCKVTEEADTENDGQPYVLCITGGPGFSHALTELSLKSFFTRAKKEGKSLPHFIVFDNLGCGDSDMAIDPDKEYTVDFFTDIAIALIESIKEKLNLDRINLCIDGGSFGSLVAMNIPAKKPQWLEAGSSIKLLQIMSRVGPNGEGMKEYTLEFLSRNHSNHVNYEKMVAAQEKLFSGAIEDNVDYLQNFVSPMATLYSPTPPPLIESHPQILTSTLAFMDWLCEQIGLIIEPLKLYNIMLNQCSLTVLNHFFKKDFDGFNLIQIINNNKALYRKIPICLMVADRDHIVDSNTAKTIQKLLPDTSAIMVFNGVHLITEGSNKPIHDGLLYAFLINQRFENKDTEHEVLHSIIPEDFMKKLEETRTLIHGEPIESFYASI